MGNTGREKPAVSGDALLAWAGIAALLVVILAAGAALRLTGLDWDEGYLLHPDERFLSWVASDVHPVASLAEYFDTPNSTLNPNNVGHRFYVYGTLPVVLLRYLGEAIDKTSLYTIYLPGRALSTSSDLLTILLLFLVARHLVGWRAGLLAAALYATSGLAIQQSHFFTVDTFTNLFAVAAFLFATRALDVHRWHGYALFGLALGLAMACKLSIAPLALVLLVAVGLRVAREAAPLVGDPDDEAAHRRMTQLSARAAAGIVTAGVVAVAVFRVAQPYAFLPPGSGVPLDTEQLGPVMTLVSRLGEPLGFRPNPDWLGQMQEIRRWVTGRVDAPPNHQWAHRPALLFPWLNMVRVGMGWPVGVFVWLAFLWALWEIGRKHRGARRLVLPVVWVAVLFVWQGVGWVTTMRYFLPVYPFLYLLGGWALVTLWNRVRALVIARRAARWHWSRRAVMGLVAFILLAGIAWGYAVSRIYSRPTPRVAASRWIVEHVPGDVTLLFQTPGGPRQVQIGLPNDWQPPDAPTGDPTAPDIQYSTLWGGVSQRVSFTMPFDATLTAIRFNRIVDPAASSIERTLEVRLIAEEQDGQSPLFIGSLANRFGTASDLRGRTYRLDTPALPLTEGAGYRLELLPDGVGPLVLAGATIATEGEWDDPVPLSVPPHNVWGALYQPLQMNLVWEDTPDKRARMQYVLDHTDYLTISSNRFYGTLPRNPQRWPMTIAYYEALFSGELGFELVGDFSSRPSLGPVEFFDDDAEEAWTVYDHPRVLVFRKTSTYNSEQSAAVLYSADLDTVVRRIAGEASGRPVRLALPPPRPAHDPTPGVFDQGAGTDWTQFDPRPADFWTRAQPVTVVVWWAAIALIGWAAFPMLWVLLPGLPDRAYPLARVFGLLFTAWLAWLAVSVDALPWTGWTVVLALIVLAGLSAGLAWPRRAHLAAWLRANRYHIAIVEAGLAALYLAFVLIRLGNPDLWHPVFGGEKPMDLAYFNAVVRTPSFPPYDPWFAGGTINYYYFGFVIVAVPVKLLGVPVTLAYNLILPTLFAVTGGAAFSAAYNLIRPDNATEHDASGGFRDWLGKPGIAAAYLAGGAALLLAVVLGNLDQIRTVLWALAELGTGKPEWSVTALPNLGATLRGLAITLRDSTPLPVGVGEWYWNATRVIPVPIDATGTPTETGPITEFPFFTFLYADLHAHMIAMPLTLLAVVWGIGQVRGAALPAEARSRFGRLALKLLGGFVGALTIGALRPTNTWDFPTYLLLGGAAVMLAHFRRRGGEHALPALGLGGVTALLAGGLFFGFGLSASAGAGNSPALALAGIGAAVGLPAGFGLGMAATRAARTNVSAGDALAHWVTLLGGALRVGLLAGATALLYLPYILNYRLGYDQVIPWTGSRTVLWAYLAILGLFLFVIASWLACELWRWLRGARRQHVMPLLLALAGVGGATALAASSISPVAWAAVPMLAVALALSFRPGQPLEKRLALVMLLGGLALTLFVEVLVLGGDLHRMNTVFKFYLQVWLLLAIVAGAALGWLWPALRRAPDALRVPWALALATLVLLAALYPLMATRAKVADRWNPDAPRTLDGMAFMPTVQFGDGGVNFSLEGDYHALRWLQDNVEGQPVVLEALGWREYLWGSRVSVYTGLPSVVGWSWHQRQQRPPEAGEVLQRHLDVRELYDTTNLARAIQLLDKYRVNLIMVGEMERAYYSPAGLSKFERMAENGQLEVVYSRNDTTIYRVVRE